jgi:hypothetical protein
VSEVAVSRLTRQLGYAGGALALAGGLLLAAAPPAAADLAEPAGACVATGTWQAGGFTVVSTDADPADVIEIPRADQVTWTGQVIGPDPGPERPIAGRISLQLPPPLGGVTVDDWSGTGTNVDSTGTESYDLPGLVPAGLVFTLHAEHRENGQLFCSGSAQLRIAGGAFDSPLVWVGLAGTALSAGLLALAGRSAPATGGRRVGRALASGLLGVLLGLFGALTLLVLGVVPLASPLVLLVVLAGAVAGAAWGGWSRWGRRPAPDRRMAVAVDGR